MHYIGCIVTRVECSSPLIPSRFPVWPAGGVYLPLYIWAVKLMPLSLYTSLHSLHREWIVLCTLQSVYKAHYIGVEYRTPVKGPVHSLCRGEKNACTLCSALHPVRVIYVWFLLFVYAPYIGHMKSPPWKRQVGKQYWLIIATWLQLIRLRLWDYKLINYAGCVDAKTVKYTLFNC